MHIVGDLPDSTSLAQEDSEWIKPIDYKHVPFRCYKFHDHSHLYKDLDSKKTQDTMREVSPRYPLGDA